MKPFSPDIEQPHLHDLICEQETAPSEVWFDPRQEIPDEILKCAQSVILNSASPKHQRLKLAGQAVFCTPERASQLHFPVNTLVEPIRQIFKSGLTTEEIEDSLLAEKLSSLPTSLVEKAHIEEFVFKMLRDRLLATTVDLTNENLYGYYKSFGLLKLIAPHQAYFDDCIARIQIIARQDIQEKLRRGASDGIQLAAYYRILYPDHFNTHIKPYLQTDQLIGEFRKETEAYLRTFALDEDRLGEYFERAFYLTILAANEIIITDNEVRWENEAPSPRTSSAELPEVVRFSAETRELRD